MSASDCTYTYIYIYTCGRLQVGRGRLYVISVRMYIGIYYVSVLYDNNNGNRVYNRNDDDRDCNDATDETNAMSRSKNRFLLAQKKNKTYDICSRRRERRNRYYCRPSVSCPNRSYFTTSYYI